MDKLVILEHREAIKGGRIDSIVVGVFSTYDKAKTVALDDQGFDTGYLCTYENPLDDMTSTAVSKLRFYDLEFERIEEQPVYSAKHELQHNEWYFISLDDHIFIAQYIIATHETYMRYLDEHRVTMKVVKDENDNIDHNVVVIRHIECPLTSKQLELKQLPDAADDFCIEVKLPNGKTIQVLIPNDNTTEYDYAFQGLDRQFGLNLVTQGHYCFNCV